MLPHKNKKIKILYINHNAGWGGSEQSLYDILKHIDREEFEPILCVPEEGILANKARELNVKTYVLKNYSWRWYYPGVLARLKFLILSPQVIFYLFKWRAFLKKIKPDIVHININRVVEQLWVTKFLKIKTVLHFRDIPSKVRRPFWGGLKTFYYFANFADYWIANSKASFKDIKPYTKKEIRIINNFIDISNFDFVINAINIIPLMNSISKIAMIGSLVDWKNHIDFIQIAKLVYANNKKVEFFIVGDGPMYSHLITLVNQYKLKNKIIFTKFIKNITSVYKKVDILAHSTIEEPFGRVFIEAMAARKPVVAYNSGGAAEIVINNETGFLVENGNIKEFAEKINILLDNPELAKQMGIAGRKRVEECYNSKIIIKQFEDFYLEILNDE